jgi:hypothetical protein
MAESESDPRAVLVTDSHKVAQTVVDWLAAEGIASELIVPESSSSTDPLTGLTEEESAGEFEVRVLDAGRIEDARKLISDAQRAAQLRAIREGRSKRTGTVTAICEDCGKPSEWPAAAMGTTETCPHCTHYMDIPDPEDDWTGVDFGSPEDAETEEPEEKS